MYNFVPCGAVHKWWYFLGWCSACTFSCAKETWFSAVLDIRLIQLRAYCRSANTWAMLWMPRFTQQLLIHWLQHLPGRIVSVAPTQDTTRGYHCHTERGLELITQCQWILCTFLIVFVLITRCLKRGLALCGAFLASQAAMVKIHADFAVETTPTKPIEGQKPGTSGLRKKTKVFMEGTYLGTTIPQIGCSSMTKLTLTCHSHIDVIRWLFQAVSWLRLSNSIGCFIEIS